MIVWMVTNIFSVLPLHGRLNYILHRQTNIDDPRKSRKAPNCGEIEFRHLTFLTDDLSRDPTALKSNGPPKSNGRSDPVFATSF